MCCWQSSVHIEALDAVLTFIMGFVDHSILPDEELVVINTHEHDDEDLESFFGVSSSNGQPQPERGFTGTALSSHAVQAMPP
jgi:hypothetical protein